MQQQRDVNVNTQKHCILVCNSPPYLLPVMESHTYAGKTGEQLAAILQEVPGYILSSFDVIVFILERNQFIHNIPKKNTFLV